MKVIFLGSLVTETTTPTDQAVVAVNAGEQGPNSISEAVFHSDVSTVQQHIVGGVVSSGRENGKKSRKPRILEFIILNGGSYGSRHIFKPTVAAVRTSYKIANNIFHVP